MRLRLLCLLVLVLASALAQAQVVVPRFAARGTVDEALLSDFMRLLRSEIGRQTGLLISDGDLVTAGLAGSLDPEFTYLIAQLYGMRYALSGEVAQVASGGLQAPYTVSLLIADSENARSTDVLSEPFSPDNLRAVAQRLAAEVAGFVTPMSALEAGSAALFVSSTPGEANVFINGVEVGQTSALDVLMLTPGSYALELRKEGFLPAARSVTLRADATEFVNVALTALAGGSVQVISRPAAQVFLDGEPVGWSPLTIQASPGTRRVSLQRPGFETITSSVPVQNYRVGRVNTSLAPIFPSMIFWQSGDGLLYVGGVLRTGGFIGNPGAGEHLIEWRRGSELRRFIVTMPDTGVFELDFERERLRPWTP